MLEKLVPTLHLTLYQKMWLLLSPFFLFSLILSHPNTCIFSTQTTWFLPVTVVRTSMDQGLQRWEPDEREREKERGGDRDGDCSLIAQLSTQPATLHLLTCHLSFPHHANWVKTPGNVTMSCHHVPKHGTEKRKKSEQLGTLSFFFFLPCKPRRWYLICSILSSSFKSPPTPSDPSRGPI